MITVRDLALSICNPGQITVHVGTEEYNIVDTFTESVNKRMINMLGDYVVEEFKAHDANTYTAWVLMRPVKHEEKEALLF